MTAYSLRIPSSTQSNDVEFVEGDTGIGQMFCHAFDEGRRHVHADAGDLLRLALVLTEELAEFFQCFGVPAFGDEHHLARFGIGGEHQVILAAAAGGLVDGKHAEAGQIRFGQRQIDIAAADGVNPVLSLANHAGDRGKRHLAAHGEDQCLKQQRETGELARPSGKVSRGVRTSI